VQRAAKLFDRVIVAVAKNESKHPLFTLEERKVLVKKAVTHLPNVRTDDFDGLLVEYAVACKAQAIVRGLRAVTDFDYEFQMAGMNYRMAPDVETVFLMASETHQFIASRLVKEVAMLGGDISSFVPPLTLQRVLLRIRG